jgi:hypothetical protein
MLGQMLGMILLSFVSMWVAADAAHRGKDVRGAMLWAAGVFLLLIIVLPLYLMQRGRMQVKNTVTAPTESPGAANACRYCGAAVSGDPIYCPHCSKQLKGSDTIHRST